MKGQDYIKAKGISLEMVQRFKLGLAIKGGLLGHLTSKGFTIEECIESGVITVRNGKVTDFFEHAVIFPISVRGKVVSLTGRMLSESAPSKFMHLKGEISYLYNEDVLYETDEIIICEGAIDAITAVQHGYSAVGVLGAQSFKESYVPKFRSVSKIYSCLDNDEGGNMGTKRLDEVFHGDIKVIKLPEGMDLNGYFNS